MPRAAWGVTPPDFRDSDLASLLQVRGQAALRLRRFSRVGEGANTTTGAPTRAVGAPACPPQAGLRLSCTNDGVPASARASGGYEGREGRQGAPASSLSTWASFPCRAQGQAALTTFLKGSHWGARVPPAPTEDGTPDEGYVIWLPSGRRVPLVNRTCAVCGASLDGRRRHARFCSPACRREHSRLSRS